VSLTDDGTLVVQRQDTPIDFAEAVRAKTFTRVHVYGRPTNLHILGTLAHLVELRLQSTGHVDFTSISGLTNLETLSYFSGSLKKIDLAFVASRLRQLTLGRHRSLTELRPIEVCQGLERLSLSHLPNRKDCPSLTPFRALKVLELINLRSWPSLRELEGAGDLEWLCVSRTKIGDGRWEPLLNLAKLRFLGGMADAFGPSAAAEFKTARPDIQVVG
jgi:hypothetical protein